MTNRLSSSIAFAAIMLALTAAEAGAQAAESNYMGRATELGGSIGAARTSSETAATIGGVAGWGINRRVTVEARGAWFARGENASGAGGDIGALLNLVPKRLTTPYVGLGFGLYRETIESPAAEVSPFYRSRVREATGGATSIQTFTDPAWRFSAGVDIIKRRTISIRPEASLILVHGNGATDAITTVGVWLGYIFEHHPVTPSGR